MAHKEGPLNNTSPPVRGVSLSAQDAPEAIGKTKILAAALEEFAAKRYAAASVQSIADRAGVTKALIYHHFGSKKKLYMATFESSLNRLLDAVLHPKPTGDLIEVLVSYTHRKLVFYLENPADYKLVYVAALLPPPELASEVAELSRGSAAPLLKLLMDKAAELPLKPGIEPKDFVLIVQTLSESIQKQFTDKYGDLPDRGIMHMAEFEDDLPRYLRYVCYGMLTEDIGSLA